MPITDKEIERIRQESAAADKVEPRAVAARFDADARALVLSMRGGASLAVPLAVLPGLDSASDEELAGVGVFDNGADIEWPALDVQMTVMAILQRTFGIVTASESARRAGSVTSAAKAAAVRENGKKGGRPRKTQSPRVPVS